MRYDIGGRMIGEPAFHCERCGGSTDTGGNCVNLQCQLSTDQPKPQLEAVSEYPHLEAIADGKSFLDASVRDECERILAERDSLRAEVERLKRLRELDQRALDRWLPCADHRDKTQDGTCYVCAVERLKARMDRCDLEDHRLEVRLRASLAKAKRRAAAAEVRAEELERERDELQRGIDRGEEVVTLSVHENSEAVLAETREKLRRVEEAAQAMLDGLPDFPFSETPDECAIRPESIRLAVRDVRRLRAVLASIDSEKPKA